MTRFLRNAIGPLGLALALLSAGVGGAGYAYAIQRDEQARAVPLRSARGDAELAERNARGAKLLGELSAALVSLAYTFAIAAGVAALGPVAKGWPWQWWTVGGTLLLAAVGVAFGMVSRPG